MKDLERIGFLGKLNMDDDPLYVKQGDYTNALNVRPLTDNTESSQSIVNIIGNQYAVSLGAISSQNKTYSIDVDKSANFGHIIEFKDQNGTLLTQVGFTLDSAQTIDQNYNIIISAISSAFSLTSPPQTFTSSYTTTGASTFNIQFTLTTVFGRDYTLVDPGLFTPTLPISIVQEAYDSSLIGDMQVIGGFDLLGDLFVWSTSQTNLPSTLTTEITTITNGTPSVVTTDAPHGLTQGQLIKIDGTSDVSYEGFWIVSSIISPTSFSLGGTSALGASLGGSVTINTQGIGEVGVIQYNENTEQYSYVRLLRSKELNFVTKKQIDTYVERNSSLVSLYWTDEYNNPRVLYYKGDYVQDGALLYYNSLGSYEYGTINTETRLFINQQPTIFSFVSQSQTGGALKSGNWRYSYRFVTDSGISTEWSDLSNPIPVFKSSTLGVPSQMSGDDASVTTTKSNSFNISNIIPDIYKYIELAGINYISSDSQSGYIIRKELLGNSTSITLNHTGLEQTSSLDLGTLNVRDIAYDTAKNITAIDNRLVLSNLTTKQQTDFSAWTQTWKHTIIRQTIEGVGTDEDPNVLKVAEYNNPNNVFNYGSRMLNEVYREGAKFRLKDGSLTNVFWIDDIRIDTSATNITSPNRRVGALASYDLTDNGVSSNNIYSFAINFNDIDIDFRIDGIPARELIQEIIFERAEVVKEILFSGVAVLGTQGGNVGALSDASTLTYNNPSARVGEYPFVAPRDNNNIVTYPSTGTAVRTLLALYATDNLYGEIGINSISAANGDEIINFGNPKLMKHTAHNTSDHYNGTYNQYSGYLGGTTVYQTTTPKIQELYNVAMGVDSTTFSGSVYSKVLIGGTNQWQTQSSPVVRVNVNLTNISAETDYGFYNIQYKRPIPYVSEDDNKYGNRVLTKYIPTGFSMLVDSDSAQVLNLNVFGGDVFTQKTYLKYRFASSSVGYGIDGLGWSSGISFYSQNRVNSQLNRRYDNTFNTWDFPKVSPVNWLTQTGTTQVDISSPFYNSGYNLSNNINSDVAFDSSSDSPTDYPVRIIYSDLKIQNGLVDGYRNFLPLNFKDLDLSFGEIVHTANGNGELITWQPRKFQRQYFNTTGILQTSSNLNVLIGDGSVLSRDGQTLSTIGSKHKWAIIKGKSPQGNDSFYWINTELKKAIRFGYDGTISLADVRGMQSFLANNLTWVDGKDTPADGEGISGVWDDRFMEAIFTVRGKRVVSSWNTLATYQIGSIVSYTPSTYSTYEQTGEIYMAKTVNSGKTPQSFTADWELISHSDGKYYNEYTLVYNEMRNGFSSFYSFLPKIYLKWKDTFFTPQPINSENRIYIHNKGVETTWYSDGSSSQIVDGFIEGVVNAQPGTVKWFEANRFNTEIVPERVDYKTKSQESFLVSSEFTSREDNFDSTIKMDSTGLSINDSQTSRLYGKYLKVKMTFKSGVYQKLFDFIVKFRNSVRLPNK